MADEVPEGYAPSVEVLDGTFDLARSGLAGPLGEMIDAGVPIEARNGRGDTLLIVAAYAEQSEVVAELLRRGADADATNTYGQTALVCAVFRRNAPLVEALLEAGADPEAGSPTPAQTAHQFGLAGMGEILQRYAR